MDTSSYNQGALVGGVLGFPDYYFVPLGQVVTEEQIEVFSSAQSTFTLVGSVTPSITLTSNRGDI